MHRLLAQVLPGADAVLVRALAEDLLVRRLPHMEWPPVQDAVVARWVALDAPEAMSWAQERDAILLKASGTEAWKPDDSLSSAVLLAWARVDPRAALALHPMNRKEVYHFHLAWGEKDPGAAFKNLSGEYLSDRFSEKTIFYGERADDPSGFLLKEWAEKEPEAALAFISENFPERVDFLVFLARGWAVKNPAACGKWMATLSGESRGKALDGLAFAASENPAGIASILDQFPPGPGMETVGLTLAGDWARQAPAEALGWVSRWFPEGQARRCALVRVGAALAERDLSAAVSVMDQAGWENGTDPAFGPLLGRLGMENPALGIHCFAKAAAGSKQQVLEYFAPAWLQHDLEAALRWLAAVPALDVDSLGMEKILNRFSGFTPETMRDWAMRLPAGPLDEALIRLSIRTAAVGDPEKALTDLPFTDAAGRAAAVEEIVRKWAERSPREALDRWRDGPEPVSPTGLAAIVSEWTAWDPAAASAWTAAVPAGAQRDAAIQGLITSLSDPVGNPDLSAAVTWSLELCDPAARIAALRKLLPELAGGAAGPEAVAEARKALARPGALPEEDRDNLLKLLDP